MSLLYVLFILIVTDVVMLAFKAKHYKDLSIAGAILPRIYLLYILGLIIYSGESNKIFVVAITIMFFGDILTGIVGYKEFRRTKECMEYLKANKNLLNKISSAFDTFPTPIFTIDMDGYIEYCNLAFEKLLGIDKGVGKNLLNLIETDCDLIAELRKEKRKECLFRTDSGAKRILIIGNETMNGHKTITGSIYLIN